MKKSFLGLALTAAISITAPQTVTADAGTAPVLKTVGELMAMSKADRRSYLKSIDGSQRRGLWLQMKNAERAAKKIDPKLKGTGMTPHAVSIDQRSFLNTAAPNKVGKAIGTIAYDNGFPTSSFSGGALVGNRFNTHTGIPAVASGTVSTIQALVVPGAANTTNSAGFVIHNGAATAGGNNMAVFSTFGSASGQVDSISFAGLGAQYTGSSFLVLFGDFASVYVPVFGTGTTLGQGHHGLVGYTGGQGPNITNTFDFGGALNSYIRATGNIVPVELMSFGVE